MSGVGGGVINEATEVRNSVIPNGVCGVRNLSLDWRATGREIPRCAPNDEIVGLRITSHGNVFPTNCR